MEGNKSKKGWLKLVAAFLAGGVIVAVLLMATTGSLFTGSVKGIITPSTNIAPVDVNQLRTQLNELKSQVNDLQTLVYSTGDLIQTINDQISKLATKTQITTLLDQLNALKLSYDNHAHIDEHAPYTTSLPTELKLVPQF